jgi:hypothetical protein
MLNYTHNINNQFSSVNNINNMNRYSKKNGMFRGSTAPGFFGPIFNDTKMATPNMEYINMLFKNNIITPQQYQRICMNNLTSSMPMFQQQQQQRQMYQTNVPAYCSMHQPPIYRNSTLPGSPINMSSRPPSHYFATSGANTAPTPYQSPQQPYGNMNGSYIYANQSYQNGGQGVEATTLKLPIKMEPYIPQLQQQQAITESSPDTSLNHSYSNYEIFQQPPYTNTNHIMIKSESIVNHPIQHHHRHQQQQQQHSECSSPVQAIPIHHQIISYNNIAQQPPQQQQQYESTNQAMQNAHQYSYYHNPHPQQNYPTLY